MSKKNNLMLRFASLLLVCVLISTYTLCGLLARYTTSGSSWDNARVIEFNLIDLNETGDFEDTGTAVMLPGNNLTKDVKLSYQGSESETYIFLEIELLGNWSNGRGTIGNVDTYSIPGPKEAMISFGIINTGWTYYEQADATKRVYYRVVEPNNTIENLQITADSGEVIISKYITRSELANLTSTEINFRAIVVQSNGFESVDAAWNDVK